MVLTEEQIRECVSGGEGEGLFRGQYVGSLYEHAVGKFKCELVERRYRFNVGQLMGEIRGSLTWVDGKQVKQEVNRQVGGITPPTHMHHLHTHTHTHTHTCSSRCMCAGC